MYAVLLFSVYKERYFAYAHLYTKSVTQSHRILYALICFTNFYTLYHFLQSFKDNKFGGGEGGIKSFDFQISNS